jgi:uncharacterized protein YbbK (DUF523 family)
LCADSRRPALFSACLLGLSCRWDGDHCLRGAAAAAYEGCGGPLVCPEHDGGLTVPRLRSTLAGGDGDAVLDGRARVLDERGRDVTAPFLAGAREAVRLARLSGARRAYLKAGSPSCGVHATNVGARRVPGRGVAAAALARAGLTLVEVE